MAEDIPGYLDDKEDLLKRLRRISGQVGGIERMVDEERYCIDILTQIAAVTTALTSSRSGRRFQADIPAGPVSPRAHSDGSK